MATRTLDLKGIPEPVARGLEVVAEMARTLARKKVMQPKRRKKVKLTPVKGGRVLTPLTREEIYADDDE
ncbi:MAG: hypothetical protein AB7G75_08965 [Candidatus Binatia bacterium]